MRRIGLGLAVFLFLSPAARANDPICNVLCEPSPSSPTYEPTVPIRPVLYNLRGSSAGIAPRQNVAGQEILPGSESYNYAIPILRLPGRNGLDLNLTLFYNSRIWTINKSANRATFNADRDFPSYGFRLGFGYIEKVPNSSDYILTEADGSKRTLFYVTATAYDSRDSSFRDV